MTGVGGGVGRGFWAGRGGGFRTIIDLDAGGSAEEEDEVEDEAIAG